MTGWSRASIDGLRGGRAVVGGMAAMPAGSWQPAPPVIPHGGPSPAQVPYPAFRFVTLAAYQGSNKQQLHLEVLWAPILLLHLDRLDGITAYSIHDSMYKIDIT